MNTKKLEKIVNEWIGTPYHHQAKLKGVGVDCCNFILAVGEELGYVKGIVLEPYNLQWHLHSKEEKMLNLLEKYGCKKTYKLNTGSILCFRYGRACSHLGILMPDGEIAHAAIDYGKVVKHQFSEEMLSRLGAIYLYPERIK